MRYFRSWIFDVGVVLVLVSPAVMLYVVWPLPVLALAIQFPRAARWLTGGGGFGAVDLDLTPLGLAMLVGLIGLGLVIGGARRVSRRLP